LDDRQGARRYGAAIDLASRRRGDRMSAAKLAAILAGESPANRDSMGAAGRMLYPPALMWIDGAPDAEVNDLSRCLTPLQSPMTFARR
jgi:hypothetical protein